MAKKIFIGVGHGGSDPGACNVKRREADDNLRLSLLVKDKLLAQGQRVKLSRETDTGMTPAQRRQMALDWRADILVDIHRNSFTDPAAKGIEIWVRYNKYAATAATVLEYLAAVPNQANRGVKIGNFAVLADAGFSAMLLELGFISNAIDNELYDKYLDDNATAVTRGILDVLGESYKVPGKTAPPASKPLYRVQVGAFSVRENAERFLQAVRDMGLAALLIRPEEAAMPE